MDWQVVTELFGYVVDAAPDTQTALLQQYAIQYPQEAEEVAALIAEEQDLRPLFGDSQPELWSLLLDMAWEGKTLGVYRLVQHLGSGGMGTVLLAERNDGEFAQVVALKVVQPGAWSDKVAEAFRNERQILANLQHPHIARLLDGGTSDEGIHYFTMEYVQGQDILTYAESQQLSTTARIQLLLQVCDALGYAHRNLILHLDIKPSNVLVGESGRTKLLDFGIAQALANQTNIAQSFFTQRYAAPERKQQQPPTTQTDIYSLGILMQDLLPAAVLHDHPFASDILAIVTKATQPTPADRYSSVGALATDLQAHLTHQPVTAYTSTKAYRLRKYLFRHRTVLRVVAAALVILIAVGIWYTQRLQHEKRVAQLEASKARRLADYLVHIFANTHPDATGADFTVQQLLDSATVSMADQLPSQQPEVAADIYAALSEAYYGIKLYAPADSLAHLALQLKRQLYPPGHASLISSLFNTAFIAADAGHYERAQQLYTELQQTIPAQSESDEHEENMTLLNYSVANLHYENGEFLIADSLFRTTLASMWRQQNPPHSDLADVLHMIGTTQRKLGKYDTAAVYLSRSLAMKEAMYTPPHSETAYTLNHLASLYYDQQQYDSAIYYAQRSLAQRRLLYGPAKDETIASQANLARSHRAAGHLDTAILLYQDALQNLQLTYGTTYHGIAGLLSNLGSIERERGRLPEAERYYRRAYQIMKDLLPPDHYRWLVPENGLANLYYQQQRYADALPHWQRVVSLREQNLYRPADTIQWLAARYHLGRCMQKVGRTVAARSTLTAVYRAFQGSDEERRAELAKHADFASLSVTNQVLD